MELRIKDKNVYLDDEDINSISLFNLSIVKNKEANTEYVRVSTHLNRFIMGVKPTDLRVVDHINGNPLDNRKSNLRIVSRAVNAQNSRRSKINKSGHIGVNKQILSSGIIKYHPYIVVNRKLIHLGTFDTIEEAVEIRKKEEARYYDLPSAPFFEEPFSIIYIREKEILLDTEDIQKIRKIRIHFRATRLHLDVPLHRYIMGLELDDRHVIDHIDGNGLNNKKSNLRIISVIENSRNLHIKKANKTGYHGVKKIRRKNKDGVFTIRYQARICVNHKDTYLGSFFTPEDAHKAYLDGVQKYFGDIAVEGRRSIENVQSE
jgi:hypothetical protein